MYVEAGGSRLAAPSQRDVVIRSPFTFFFLVVVCNLVKNEAHFESKYNTYIQVTK